MTIKPQLIPASLDDYPTVQNMARFYVYEMSRECGLNSTDWACPTDGLYDSFDFKHYFVDPDRRAYLVKVDQELAGFVLLYQTDEQPNIQWHIGEFFILARFQNRGVGRMVAQQVWQQHPGSWEVTVIPENQRALQFWRKAVASVMQYNFIEELKLKTGRVDPDQPNRIFLTFDTSFKKDLVNTKPITIRAAKTTDINAMVALSHQKRLAYEKVQPQFWRHALDAESQQTTWFNQLLEQDNHFLFVAEFNKQIIGFVIGRLRNAPEVYQPEGLTLEIDDFCIESSAQWPTVGNALLHEIKTHAKIKGATQLLVVCGAHDAPKANFLKNNNTMVASEWYVGTIL